MPPWLLTNTPKKACRFQRWDEFGAARNNVKRRLLFAINALWYNATALIRGALESKPNVLERLALIPNGCTPLKVS